MQTTVDTVYFAKAKGIAKYIVHKHAWDYLCLLGVCCHSFHLHTEKPGTINIMCIICTGQWVQQCVDVLASIRQSVYEITSTTTGRPTMIHVRMTAYVAPVRAEKYNMYIMIMMGTSLIHGRRNASATPKRFRLSSFSRWLMTSMAEITLTIQTRNTRHVTSHGETVTHSRRNSLDFHEILVKTPSSNFTIDWSIKVNVCF